MNEVCEFRKDIVNQWWMRGKKTSLNYQQLISAGPRVFYIQSFTGGKRISRMLSREKWMKGTRQRCVSVGRFFIHYFRIQARMETWHELGKQVRQEQWGHKPRDKLHEIPLVKRLVTTTELDGKSAFLNQINNLISSSRASSSLNTDRSNVYT
jgi:hypothetical protein